ncbi:MAG: FAD-dependent oxidoreductase [Deltaproteobacteria bacterium]|nr:FAD-dependent oxidoreductase [Deltaproteobacteria bacterium]
MRILYRRSQEEMPADPDELAQAEAEGVEIMFLVSPTLISVQRNRTILHLIRNKLTRRDISGRRRPKPIKGTDFSMEVDTVVTAIGQHSLDTDKKNTLRVDKETLMTSREGVFAAGDVVSGPRTVTEAIAMGEKAASAINRYIGGEALQCDGVPEDSIPPLLDQDDQFFMRRVPMQTLSAEERRMGFGEVELGYTEDMAVKEANRCLHCSLRLDILG